MNRNFFSKLMGYTLSACMLVSVVVFLFMLYKLDMIPSTMFKTIGFILGGVALLMGAMQFTKAHIVSSVISLFLLVVMVLGCVYIGKTYDVFQTKIDTTVENYSIVALSSFNKNSIKDCGGCLFGYNDKVRSKSQLEVLDSINKELAGDLGLVSYGDWFDMVDALYSGGIDVIVLNESYRSVLEDNYEDFSKNTKIIGSEKYETKVEVKINDVEAVKEPFVVYLSANDDYGNLATNGRSDVNIVAVVNPTRRKILMVTIPRDSYVQLRFEDDSKSSYGDKLTHAGVYGVQTSINTIEDMLGIDINYYMKINFSGLIELVDALGGITVDSDYEFTTYDTTHHFVKGENKLNGLDAMYFARERYAFQDGDFQRSRDQIKVINAIINKALSPVILTKYLQIMDSLKGLFDTNFPYEDIAALVKMQLDKMPNWDMESLNITGSVGSEYCYTYGTSLPLSIVYPDEAQVKEAKALIDMYMK